MSSNQLALKQESLASKNHSEIHTLYSNHHRWLYSWLCKRLGSHHHAEDVAQNTFLRLFSLANLSNITEPRGFLTTTATRLLIDESRRNKIEKHYLETYSCYFGSEATTPSEEELALISETLAAVIEMLESLPEKCQQAFLMSKLEGMRYADIAIELNVSKSMVQQYISKAMVAYYKFTYNDDFEQV